ncbi:alkaline phosphatase D family protein [Rufibacter quisquiliarum]|uniref:Alkaline phosphatase D n=1 Tax=Rufibacter quisquiliarum TaxID=1549639 RepID=A0A839GNU9_9BACT|nr:alkaline phosphatase D family protein [Rufibacter quisquiliarum]MBA9078479.1 alkaline phosphatase D [Rufibacter quisquiliarum]
MRIVPSALLLLLWLFPFTFLYAGTDTEGAKKKKAAPAAVVTTIAFGSCNREDMPQPLWADILENKPQLWVWLGGNVDNEETNINTLSERYQQQLRDPGYSALRGAVPVIGTWDHHDYGIPQGGKEFEHKTQSQKLFWDFMGVAEDSPLRGQEGVYSAHTYGPKGQRVKIILLDTRYHRDSLFTDKNVCRPNPKGDILGEAQWKWLEKELKSGDAELTLIGSGTQIIPEEHDAEKWANYPKSRERLLKLVSRTQGGVVLLSGERHFAEISRFETKNAEKAFYEVTSSGLTHSLGRDYDIETNKYRVGNMVAKRNFGLVQIDWEKREAVLKVQGDRNTTYLSQALTF